MSGLQEELSAKYVLVVTHPFFMKDIPVLNFLMALFIAPWRIRPELHSYEGKGAGARWSSVF